MRIGRLMLSLMASSLFLLPFGYLLVASLAGNWSYPALVPLSWQTSAWRALIGGTNPLFSGFRNSVLIALLIAFCTTLFGFLLSRQVMKYRFPARLIVLTYFPFVLSPVVYAILMQYFFIRWGLSGGLTGVLLAQFLVVLPFALILFYPFWTPQIAGLEGTSYTLGSSFRFTFFHVLLPVAKPQLIVCFFQTFLISWFEFGLTATIGLGKVKTLTLQVFEYVGEANIPYAAVSSLLLVLPPVVLLWFNKRYVFTKLD